MKAEQTDRFKFVLSLNYEEENSLKHVAEQLNIEPQTIISWIVSYELLKYYQEIQF